MDVLKDFYWESYQIVQKLAPHWITLLHDSFRLSLGEEAILFHSRDRLVSDAGFK